MSGTSEAFLPGVGRKSAVSINYFGSVRLASTLRQTFAEDSHDIFSFRRLSN